MANVFEPELGPEDGPAGFRSRLSRVARDAGSEHLGATLYELPPGETVCPYHWHVANEEMLIVLRGSPRLRTPDGERDLEEGELVAFPRGEAGAHTVSNPTQTPARLLVVSEMNAPEIAVYPDSDKVMAREQPPGTPATGIRMVFRASDRVDYWEGEAGNGEAG